MIDKSREIEEQNRLRDWRRQKKKLLRQKKS